MKPQLLIRISLGTVALALVLVASCGRSKTEQSSFPAENESQTNVAEADSPERPQYLNVRNNNVIRSQTTQVNNITVNNNSTLTSPATQQVTITNTSVEVVVESEANGRLLTQRVSVPVAVVAQPPLSLSTPTRRFTAMSGSSVRIDGTSNIHDWQVRGSLIGGFLEIGPNFPTDSDQSLTPGPVEARGEVFISVSNLGSVEKEGRPYSDKMDDVMREKLRYNENPKIFYKLKELVLKSTEAGNNATQYLCESKGQLTVAGETKEITMPIRIQPVGNGKVKILGETSLKMTDFNIEPPQPKLTFGLIKTGDSVRINFEWVIVEHLAAQR